MNFLSQIKIVGIKLSKKGVLTRKIMTYTQFRTPEVPTRPRSYRPSGDLYQSGETSCISPRTRQRRPWRRRTGTRTHRRPASPERLPKILQSILNAPAMHHRDSASATTGTSRSRGACPKSGSHQGR